MQVVYKEMTRDEARSNLLKWNLIGGIQFKHMKNCFCPCSVVIGYVPIDLWTLFSMAIDVIQIVWRVS